MSNESDAPVLATSDMFGNEIDFNTYEDVVQKARDVVSNWEEFFKKVPENLVDNGLSEARGVIHLYNTLESDLSVLGKKGSKTERDELAQSLGRWMNNYEPVLGVESNQGKSLRHMAKIGFQGNPLAGVLQIALGGRLPNRFDDDVHNAISVYLGQTELARLALEKNPQVHIKLQDIASNFQSLKNSFDIWFKEAKSQSDEKIQKFSENGIKQIEAYTSKAGVLVENLEKNAEQAKATANALEQRHQLKQPAVYWSEKRDQHQAHRTRYAWLAGIWFFVGGAAAVWLAVSSWPVIPNSVPEGHKFIVWPYLLMVGKGLLLVTVYLWIARILVRLFLSEVHLAMDANQRITMTESYLAMVNEGAIGTEPEYASKILEALFRPTQDGIVKDDASSDPVMSMIWQRIAKGN